MILLRVQLDARTIFIWFKTSCQNNASELVSVRSVSRECQKLAFSYDCNNT